MIITKIEQNLIDCLKDIVEDDINNEFVNGVLVKDVTKLPFKTSKNIEAIAFILVKKIESDSYEILFTDVNSIKNFKYGDFHKYGSYSSLSPAAEIMKYFLKLNNDFESAIITVSELLKVHGYKILLSKGKDGHLRMTADKDHIGLIALVDEYYVTIITINREEDSVFSEKVDELHEISGVLTQYINFEEIE